MSGGDQNLLFFKSAQRDDKQTILLLIIYKNMYTLNGYKNSYFLTF